MRALSEVGLDLIKSFEGLRLEAYDDNGARPGGVWTIGYGHTKGVQPGDRITHDDAERLLREDLAVAIRAVERKVSVPLSDNQFAALVSWTFNLGEGALQRSTLLRRLNAGRYDDVPDQIRRWVYQGRTRLRGLERRRAAEAELWLADQDPCANYVTATEGRGKPAHRSRTVLGGGIAALSTIVIAAADQIHGYAGLSGVPFWVLTGITLFGCALAIYGRIRVMREEGA